MKIIFSVLLLLLWNGILLSQVKEPPVDNTLEQQLENNAAGNDDQENEDDSYLQELAQYRKDKLNLNTATADQLTALRFLNSLQIESLISYRNYLGILINVYELQAVPGWDVATIQKILPFITVSAPSRLGASIAQRLRNGDQYLLGRLVQILEQSKGYILDSSTATNFYPGSPQRLFLRYRYNYKNLLQYGFTAEKDAGEQFFNGYQKNGFDFYSAHFFVRDIGIVKAIALGDYSVNMGQGLTQWMSLAFKKGAAITNTKRQAAVLRPYSSPGEVNFHRGAGITLGKKNWEATVFASYKNIDANLQSDTSLIDGDFVSSLQTSGFHRTKNEADDKGAQKQFAFGGNVKYQAKAFQIGFNAIQYKFQLPVQRDPQPYNKYAIKGKDFGNYSTDYSYTYRNLHFFGEAAISYTKYPAFVNGLLMSVAQNVDMSFVYRNISRGYQSLYTSAFTESTFPTNEKGLYSGITVRANSQFQVDAYADIYKFPWLRFRVNTPSTGKDYFLQLTYRPNRSLEVYSRFKAEEKPINYNPDGITLNPVIPQPRQSWRTQFSLKTSPTITIRSRVELAWYDHKGPAKEEGFLMYADVLYKPIFKPLSGNVRVQYFETGGFNSRLYAFESDVLYSYAIPVFSGKGYRYYMNLNYDLSKKVTLWAKIAQTYYLDRDKVGSGLDEIDGSSRTEVKLQGMLRF